MDKLTNPYTPGAGRKPLILAGRDHVLEEAELLLKRTKRGFSPRPIMLYGLRGVGKTVLLNSIEEIARNENIVVEHLEMSEKDDFKKVIAFAFRRILLSIDRTEQRKEWLKKALGVLKSFKITLPDGGPELTVDVESILGEGDSGDFEHDLIDLVKSLGLAAKEYGKCVCILIDEVQYIDERSLAALVAANHRISQDSLPVVFICAGLPQVLALTGDAKSYSERLFHFIKVNGLLPEDARKAIVGPANEQGASYDEASVTALIDLTGGYPYFIQEFCKFVWDIALGPVVERKDVDAAKSLAFASLDESFFKVRFDRATEKERAVMKAMAEIKDGPAFRVSDILTKAKLNSNQFSPVRDSLIKKGFLYSEQHGFVSFTVPHFDKFILRHFRIL